MGLGGSGEGRKDRVSGHGHAEVAGSFEPCRKSIAVTDLLCVAFLHPWLSHHQLYHTYS